MKTNLMYRNKEFSIEAPRCFGAKTMAADLELGSILSKMACSDADVYEACSAALFQPMTDPDEIRFRQMNMEDCLQNPEPVRRLYQITLDTEKRVKSSWYWLSPSRVVSSTYSSAAELLKIYSEMLTELRAVADRAIAAFRSDGFCRLLKMLQTELSDAYLAQVRACLREVKDGKGILISASLGDSCQGVRFVLRSKNKKGFWRRWFFAPSYSLAPRDDSGAQDFENRRARAINECTNALAQAAEHLEKFFVNLKRELAFYIGCLNLRDEMERIGMPVCIPQMSVEGPGRSWDMLYDIALAVTKNTAVISNTLSTQNKRLFLITGANQGGKSTFLRSVGQAQLMAQCGMIVGARAFSAPLQSGIFTHFKKEEDAAYTSGKLDEELARMSGIISHIKRGGLVLLNESFAATNEREGSEICRQITNALVENGVAVFSVTHLYAYAAAYQDHPQVQYLRAERKEDETRTFRMIAGAPLQTAFGADLWDKAFF
jgi:DNA mismatch repair ATPase MutS